jgi:hypothetical protein
MASGRITIDTTKNMAARIRDVATFGALFREKVSELNLIVSKYAADASFQTDTGMSAGDATTFTNLLTQMANELNVTASTQVNVGAATGTRQWLDALSTIG